MSVDSPGSDTATLQEERFAVAGVEPRTPAITEVWLRPLAQRLAFLPGHYVLVEGCDGDVPPRSYSVANAPRDDGLLSLLVTRVEGGRTSNWLHGLAVGAEVCVSGPYGTFLDDPDTTEPALLLAAGSGLAPVRALLEAALAAARRRALTLVFSARTEADVIDGECFARRQQRDPRLRYVRTLTRAGGPPPLGHIPEILPSLCDDLGEHDVFIAGAPGFVSACGAAATALGASRARVHTEVFFVDSEPEPEPIS